MPAKETTCACGCGGTVKPGRRFCRGHNKRGGPSREDRFWPKVKKTDTCWLWKGRIDAEGYGRLGNDGAHRIAYELVISPIPAGLQIDHLCRNRACVNPDHLEVVTGAENTRRRIQPKAFKKYCKHGHPLDRANTYIRPNGCRTCRICNAASQRASRERKKAGVA